MRIRVLFFGVLKDVAGRASDAVELRAGSTVGELLGHYERRFPALKPLLPSVALSLNQEYTGAEAELHAEDEVGLLPPVSGGSGAESDSGHSELGRVGATGGSGAESDHSGQSGHSELGRVEATRGAQVIRTQHARIVRERIDTQAVLEKIKKPEDGAALVFEGIVRNNTRGRHTLYLEYEAYEEMALKQMEELATEALGKFGVRDVALVHRLGRLEIGETSVLIVVASAHRAAAFEASRWLIDTLKKTVPIWKKEFFVDGALWADGEPFPVEIPRAEGSPSRGTASK